MRRYKLFGSAIAAMCFCTALTANASTMFFGATPTGWSYTEKSPFNRTYTNSVGASTFNLDGWVDMNTASNLVFKWTMPDQASWNVFSSIFVEDGGGPYQLNRSEFGPGVVSPTNAGSVSLNAELLTVQFSLPVDKYIVGTPNPAYPPLAGQRIPIQFNSFLSGSGAQSVQISVSSVGAVPEPATWALMVLGMGAVGATMRYRRRNAQGRRVVAA